MTTCITEREPHEYLKRLSVLFVDDGEDSRVQFTANDPDLSFDELLKRAVMRIPQAWQFPDITGACIEVGAKSFQTARFKETPWMVVQEIFAKENKVGKVTVCRLEERAFLQEELTLLSAIAENLSLIVTRELAKETISRRAVTDELTGLNYRLKIYPKLKCSAVS